jgi:5-formyltetrahydrofolate cyclo-ligase
MAQMSASSLESANAPGVREQKRALRDRVLAARDALPESQWRAAGTAIAQALAHRADFMRARRVLLTLPFGSEWDTEPLLAAASAQGAIVLLPRVHVGTRMLELCAVTDLARDVQPGYRGIREPGAHCERADAAQVDWVLVPGVAFDAAGRRLGYGGGFYDRLLPLLPAHAVRVAGAFELQLVDRVPFAAHDRPVQAIVTERRTLTVQT